MSELFEKALAEAEEWRAHYPLSVEPDTMSLLMHTACNMLRECGVSHEEQIKLAKLFGKAEAHVRGGGWKAGYAAGREVSQMLVAP